MSLVSSANTAKYTCGLCGHQTYQKRNLILHEQSVHEGKKFQCPECDYQATQKSSVVTHQRSVHKSSHVASAIFSLLRKIALIPIINLYIWAISSNVQNVIIRQLGKVTLLFIRSLYTWAKNFNVPSVMLSLL